MHYLSNNSSAEKNARELGESGAAYLEYLMLAAMLVVGFIAMMPRAEQSVAGRVNCGKTHYQSYNLEDPGLAPLDGSCPTLP